MNMQVSTNLPASQPPLQTLSAAPSDKLQAKQGEPSAPIKIAPNMPFSEGGVEIDLSVRGGGRGFFAPSKDQALMIKTGDSADKVHIKNSADGGLTAEINGKTYEIPFDTKSTGQQHLEIQSNGGDDNVTIDDDVKVPVSVKLGAGNDRFNAGGGRTNVYGGAGNDTIQLGSGVGYAEGNDGDDSITGGSAYSVMYGGNGNDKLRGATGNTYMDGGSGNDLLCAGGGKNVMNGGKGDDVVEGGAGQNTIYTGKGQDTVNSVSDADIIYGKKDDSIKRTKDSKFVEVAPSDVGSKAFKVEGSDEFKQLVEDDLEFLRGSPTGQKLLAGLDKTPGPITMREQPEGEGAFYNYGRKGVDHGDPRVEPPNDAEHGYITNGVAGAPADDATILYGRSFIVEEHERPPIIPVFHEMSHAFNGVNGTSLPGETEVGVDPTDHRKPQSESNRERQAVGLPTNADPFDLDNDPSTPPTNTNPAWATENGLAAELRTSLRARYFS